MLILKCFGIFCIIKSVSLAHKLPNNIVQYWGHLVESFADECLSETHPDLKDIEIVLNNGYVPSSKELGCYIKCLYSNLDVIDSNGNFSKEKMLSINLPGITPQLLDECLSLVELENDVCLKALAYRNCIDVNLSV